MSRFWFLLWLGISVPLFANPLPLVTSHSADKLVVRQGEVVELEVRAEHADRFLWFKRNILLCQTSICRIETRDWQEGHYVIHLLVINDFGSRFVEFNFRVLPSKPVGQSGRLRRPKLVPFQLPAGEGGRQESALTIRALNPGTEGYVFRFDRKERPAKLQAIRNLSRPMDGDERVRTGTAWLLMEGEKWEQIATPRSSLRLHAIEQGEHRITLLYKGGLRLRSLDPSNATHWSVVVADWLQIDASKLSDVVIEMRGRERVQVSVLRGAVSIHRRHPYTLRDPYGELSMEEQRREQALLDQNAFASRFALSAGQTVALKRRQPDLSIRPIQDNQLNSIIQASTPQYWDIASRKERNIDRQSNWSWINVTEPGFTMTEAFVSERLQAKDPIGAIELLLALPDEKQRSANWYFMAARAYQMLGIKVLHIRYLQEALRLQPDHPQALLTLAQLAMVAGKQRLAKKFLQRAYRQNSEYPDLVAYYLGVLRYDAEQFGLAERDFELAETLSDRNPIQRSSLTFLQTIRARRPLQGHAFSGLLLSSLPVLSGSEQEIKAVFGSQTFTGSGYKVGGQVQVSSRFVDAFQPFASFEIERRGWFSPVLTDIARVDQTLRTGLFWGLQASFQTALELRSIVIGQKRALDGVGAFLEWSATELPWMPVLSYRFQALKDPEPAYNKKIDALSGELQRSASDRSARLSHLELKLMPWRYRSYRLYSILSHQSRQFSNQLVRTEDHQRLAGELIVQHQWNLRHQFRLHLRYFDRNFENSAAQRLDHGLGLQAQWYYDFVPSWRLEGGFSLLQQRSTVELASYQALTMGVQIRYQL